MLIIVESPYNRFLFVQVGHLRDEFVKTRMTDLERFVGRLLANPYIQSDNSLKQVGTFCFFEY